MLKLFFRCIGLETPSLFCSAYHQDPIGRFFWIVVCSTCFNFLWTSANAIWELTVIHAFPCNRSQQSLSRLNHNHHRCSSPFFKLQKVLMCAKQRTSDPQLRCAHVVVVAEFSIRISIVSAGVSHTPETRSRRRSFVQLRRTVAFAETYRRWRAR